MPIALLYNDRPPYAVSQPDGSVEGLTATPAANAFKSAAIPFKWVKLPTNRQLSLVKESTGMNCALGWFKNPEREQFAKFAGAIYQDKPTVALANRGFSVREGSALGTVLSLGRARVLVKDHFSYGPYIDRMLAALRPEIVNTTGENFKMVQMILADRADFMFVAEEEANYLIGQAGLDSRNLRILRFADMPDGEKRYLMCSRQVPDEYIVRLNRAIAGR